MYAGPVICADDEPGEAEGDAKILKSQLPLKNLVGDFVVNMTIIEDSSPVGIHCQLPVRASLVSFFYNKVSRFSDPARAIPCPYPAIRRGS